MDQPVAIVTGAGRGIGRAAALQLANAGYRIVLVSRTREQIEQTAEMAGGGLAIAADVSRSEDVRRLVSEAVQAYGRVDALVHCAGLAPAVSVEQMTLEQWHAVLDTNLSSAFYLAKELWPVFRRQQGGVIVNISSMASRDPFPGFAAYGAAKAALNTFSLVLAREGREIGLRVHTIAPGAVETEMFRALLSVEQWPPEKTLEAADVARIAVQCVRGDLRYTSGEVIFMNR